MPFLKQMEIVTDIDKLKVDIQETIMKYQTIKHWAYIVHDKDDTRPHFSLYFSLQKFFLFTIVFCLTFYSWSFL